MVSVRPYIPNPMRCFRCVWPGNTQQRCASNLVCGVCGDPGHGKLQCPGQPHCWTAPERIYLVTESALYSWTKRPFINFGERTVFPYRMPERSSLNEPETGTQSYASVLRRPQGADDATQTTALPNRGSTSTPPQPNSRDAISARKRALRLFPTHPALENLISFKRHRAKAQRVIREAKHTSWTGLWL
jgi:hypothetical protein